MTGVQTCALPISGGHAAAALGAGSPVPAPRCRRTIGIIGAFPLRAIRAGSTCKAARQGRDSAKEKHQRRPVSRVLSSCASKGPAHGDGHFSRTPVARRLKQPYPRAPRGPRFTHAPGLRPTPRSLSYLTLLRVGFTEPARSPVSLVSSYLTVSPLPLGLRRSAVSFLWHSAVGSPPLAVSQHPALRSPDFPPVRLPAPATIRPSLTQSKSVCRWSEV